MRSKGLSLKAALVLALCVTGCGAKEETPGGGTGATGATGAGSGGQSGVGDTGGSGGGAGSGNTGGSSGGSGSGNTGGQSGSSGESGGGGDEGGSGGSAPVDEMLDPAVDWEALTLIYAPLYSAYDGTNTYQVPVRVKDAEIELAGWQAIPSTAVKFDEDPTVAGQVLITVMQPVESVTIAARNGMIGGTTTLHVTIGTPEDWEIGRMRYDNGVEYELPDFDFAQLLDPNFMPPEPPDNLACNNCHTKGAKYFEIIHSPTQASLYSDEQLVSIFTMGIKPEPVCYRVLPPDLEYLYVDFHTWESPPEEQKGLIMYLRSLTPEGQGDILLPDGTYAPPGGETACLNN